MCVRVRVCVCVSQAWSAVLDVSAHFLIQLLHRGGHVERFEVLRRHLGEK